MTSFPTVGQAAFGAVMITAAATTGSVILAAGATTKVAVVAYSALALVSGGCGIASMSAYLDPKSETAGSYWENFKEHAAVTVPGYFQLVAQTVLRLAIEGLGLAIRDVIYEGVKNFFNGSSRKPEQA